jgi:hypothetical protein
MKIVRTLLDSTNPTRIPSEVSPTLLSEAGRTVYIGWACTILWWLFYHWCRTVLGICTASRDKALIMSLQAFVALRERQMFVLLVTTACSGIPPDLSAFISLSAQHDCILWHNAILNCLVDLAVSARVTNCSTSEVTFVPYARVGPLRTASHRVTFMMHI